MATRTPLSLPPIPCIQGLNSTTSCQPPLNGSLTVSDAQDWHYEHSPNHPLFVYSDDTGKNTTIPWSEFVPAMHRAGRLVRDIARGIDHTEPPIFGILASNGSCILGVCAIHSLIYVYITRDHYLLYPAIWNPSSRLSSLRYLSTKFSGCHHSFVDKGFCEPSLCGL